MAASWKDLTARARQVAAVAQKEAARRGETTVSPEHLLLALMQFGPTPAMAVLERLGVERARVIEHLAPVLKPFLPPDFHSSNDPARPSPNPPAWADLPPDGRTAVVLEWAWLEMAPHPDRNVTGTEELLLGILHEENGAAYRVLNGLGIDLAQARAAAEANLEEARARTKAPSPEADFSASSRGQELVSQTEWFLHWRAARAVQWSFDAAHDSAVRFGTPNISSLHLLLGILKIENSAGRVLLERMGVKTEDLRRQVEAELVQRSAAALEPEKVAVDGDARAAFLAAYEEARRQGLAQLRTEHLLYALLSRGGPAAELLHQHKITPALLQEAMAAWCGGIPRGYELRYRVRRFSDPVEMSTFLQECAAGGREILHKSTSRGSAWVIARERVRVGG